MKFLEKFPYLTVSLGILATGVAGLIVNSYMYCSGGFGTGFRLLNTFYCSDFGGYLSTLIDNPSLLWHWNSNLVGWLAIAITVFGIVRLARGEPERTSETDRLEGE